MLLVPFVSPQSADNVTRDTALERTKLNQGPCLCNEDVANRFQAPMQPEGFPSSHPENPRGLKATSSPNPRNLKPFYLEIIDHVPIVQIQNVHPHRGLSKPGDPALGPPSRSQSPAATATEVNCAGSSIPLSTWKNLATVRYANIGNKTLHSSDRLMAHSLVRTVVRCGTCGGPGIPACASILTAFNSGVVAFPCLRSKMGRGLQSKQQEASHDPLSQPIHLPYKMRSSVRRTCHVYFSKVVQAI